MPGLGVGEAVKEGGVGGLLGAPGLGPVVLVVEADADDLVRMGDGGQIGDSVEPGVGVLARGGGARLAEGVGGDQRAQIGIGQPPTEIDHPLARHHAITRLAAALIAQQFHGSLSVNEGWSKRRAPRRRMLTGLAPEENPAGH